MKARTKKAPTLSANTIAARAAAEFVDSTICNMPGPNGEAEEALWLSFEKVSEAIQAEHVKQIGPISDEAGDLTLWDIGMRAGYLVGVQVGLRLRGGAL